MRNICQGRTVLIIAHRLSAVRHTDRIVVMDKGAIVEIGSHQSLLNNPAGIYSHLYRLQQGTFSEDDQQIEAQARASTMNPISGSL